MHDEMFNIEFEVPGSPDRYFEFELWVRGMWIMDEVGGGEMRQCLDIEEKEFEKDKFSNEDQVLIQKWIAANSDAIRKMFAERIKKYED